MGGLTQRASFLLTPLGEQASTTNETSVPKRPALLKWCPGWLARLFCPGQSFRAWDEEAGIKQSIQALQEVAAAKKKAYEDAMKLPGGSEHALTVGEAAAAALQEAKDAAINAVNAVKFAASAASAAEAAAQLEQSAKTVAEDAKAKAEALGSSSGAAGQPAAQLAQSAKTEEEEASGSSSGDTGQPAEKEPNIDRIIAAALRDAKVSGVTLKLYGESAFRWVLTSVTHQRLPCRRKEAAKFGDVHHVGDRYVQRFQRRFNRAAGKTCAI